MSLSSLNIIGIILGFLSFPLLLICSKKLFKDLQEGRQEKNQVTPLPKRPKKHAVGGEG